MSKAKHIAIVGGGPAGLKAAEVAASSQAKVSLFEAKRSVGRKFLVAGKSGLNLTNNEEFSSFLTRYPSHNLPLPIWKNILTQFNPEATRQWAKSLGIETFVSAGNKVFPEQMKAAPLLRRWVQKLKQSHVSLHVNHKLTKITLSNNKTELTFITPEGTQQLRYDYVILAFGGGSWPQTGSNGSWVEQFHQLGVEVTPLRSANCGWHVDWSASLLAQAEGMPIKNITICSGNEQLEGEIVITRYGLEGGPIYRLGPQIHATHQITLDLKPTFTVAQLLQKMESVKFNVLAEAIKRWKLNPASHALLKYHFHAQQHTKQQLAELVKALPIQLTKPRPIEESISSAGGVCWSELTPDLALKKFPQIYIAGEMIDWEAPTGGYLLQGCLASGFHVGQAVSTAVTSTQ